MEVCRICSQSTNVTPLSSDIKSKLSSAFKIRLGDDILSSRNICKICHKKVEKSFDFYQKVSSASKGSEDSEDPDDFRTNAVFFKEEQFEESSMRHNSYEPVLRNNSISRDVREI